MKSWADRFRKRKSSRRRRRRRGGCAICGEDVFKHKLNSYYGWIEHAYKRA